MLVRVSKVYWCSQGLDSSFEVSAVTYRSLQQQNTHMDKWEQKTPQKTKSLLKPHKPPNQPANPQNLALLLGLTLFNSNLTNSSHSTSSRANWCVTHP